MVKEVNEWRVVITTVIQRDSLNFLPCDEIVFEKMPMPFHRSCGAVFVPTEDEATKVLYQTNVFPIFGADRALTSTMRPKVPTLR